MFCVHHWKLLVFLEQKVFVKMRVYQPSSRLSEGFEFGSGGQILDLKTAVKDGILGGGALHGCVTGEKFELKKMMKELCLVEVPSVFICPISLEPMQDPVTLCTGQTYERSNILKWFSLGHVTCPTTMQELWDDSVTPNNTLYQLIYNWFTQKYMAMRKKSEDVQGRAMELLETLKKAKGQARIQALKELRQVVATNDLVKKTVVDNGGVGLISSILGNFTTHAAGSEAIGVLVNLNFDSDAKVNLRQPAKISLIVDMLNEGSIETKINCTKLTELLMDGEDLDAEIFSSLRLLVGLMRLVKDKRYPNGVYAGLRLLKLICSYEAMSNSIISIGAVSQLVEILPHLNAVSLELALDILATLSSLAEGGLALKNCPSTIPVIVKLLMKVSERCTQSALTILSAICKLAPEECAALAVDAGIAAKLLLVIQSGCDPNLKQRSAELLKLCSLNYTATIFIAKCKLTRTIH